MIPKLIHACWLGRGPRPALVEDCVSSWYERLPGYDVKIWSEDDVGIDHPYFHALLERKKWAFASDFARFWLLEKFGGVWLDTDVEVVRPFDELLSVGPFFAGYESEGQVSCGVIGSVAGHPLNRAVRDSLVSAYMVGKPPSNIPHVLTAAIELHRSADIQLYPPEYFYPYNPYAPGVRRRQLMFRDISENTFAVHHWAATWTKAEAGFRTRLLRKLGLYWGLR